MNERKLIDEIKRLVNDDVIIGYYNGTTFTDDNNKTYSNLVTNNSPIGRGFIVPYNNQWLVVVANNNQEVRKNIITSRRKNYIPDNKIVYPVITFIQSKLSNPKPEGHKDIEYWLTGGKYSLKRIVTDPTLGFDNLEAFINFEGSDAFLQNAGNGKYLAATRSHELPAINYGGVSNRKYNRNIFTIQKEDKTSVKITSDFYGNFVYLGNGIYQSFIEDGIGQIFNEVPPYLQIPGVTMRFSTHPDIGGIYLDGISKDNNSYSNLRLDANILPTTSNFCIYNNELHELSGELTIDLNNIFDYVQGVDISQYNLSNGTNYPSDTILNEANPLFPYRVALYLTNLPLYVLVIKDRTFAWRNKNVQHQVYLPGGASVFNYSSVKTKVRNNLFPADSENTLNSDFFYNYTFNETMSGEVLVMSWRSKYITSTFEITKESTNGFNDIVIDGNLTRLSDSTAEITSKTEVLTLKTYGDTEGEKNIVLNSDGKYLILPKSPKALNSNQNIEITKDTTAFRINFSLGLQYADYNPGYSITGYIGEPIITSFVIDDKAYLIRGVISNAELVLTPFPNIIDGLFNANFWFTIQITEIKSITQIKFNVDFDYTYAELPFPATIVLDNGCFWNYYLSYRNSAVDTEAFVSDYPYFRGGNTYSKLTNFRDSLSSYLLCDQTTKYIHTNPITVPFCTSIYYPPSHLLMVDNLIGDSIYRVNDDFLIQAYIESYSNKDLSITKMPVSEWKITFDGSIKYNKTFLVDYQLKRPYYNGDYDVNSTIPVTHSYHPS